MSYQASRHHKGGTKSVSCHLCCKESHLCLPPTSITQPPCSLVHVKQVQCLAHIGLRDLSVFPISFSLGWEAGLSSGVIIWHHWHACVGRLRQLWVSPRLTSNHRGWAGNALDGGTGWCATDGIKDVKRVWENAFHAILHWNDLERKECVGKNRQS